MAQKYYNSKEAAQKLGVSTDEIKKMIERRELYGYRDGADWKFKTEDIDRKAAERVAPAPGADDEHGDVLLSEIELGASEPGLSGTVIGCVAARVSSAQFAPPEGGGATVVIPVTFVSQ